MADNFKIIDSQPSNDALDSIISKTDELAVAWKDRLYPAVKAVTTEMAKGTPKEYSEAIKKAVSISKELEKVNKELTDSQIRLEKVEQEAAKTKQQLAKAIYEEEKAKAANMRTQNAELLLKQKIENIDKKEQQRIESITNAKEKARVKEIQLQQAREKAVDRFNALEKKEQQRIANAASLYSKLEQKLKSLQLEYRDLASAKELGLKLTDQEAKRYDYLKTKIERYDTTLKAVDASMGKHTRHVGNYERANNGLGMSLAQITREMPAFANSAQTGFMALSNNIPIFFDAIGQVKNLNKELQAQGKPTVSVLKQLAGALFSWQTLLSVGVTLLTVYGADIVKWGQKVLFGAESVDKLKESQDSLNKAIKDSDYKKAVRDVSEMRNTLELAKQGVISKDKALRFYNETLGKVMGTATSLNEAEMILTKNADNYIKATLYKAAANLALDKAAEQALKAEEARRKTLEQFNNEFLDASIENIRTQEQYEAQQRRIQKNRENRQKAEIKIAKDAQKAQEEIAKDLMKTAAQFAKGLNFDFSLDLKDPKTPKEKKPKTPKEKKDDTLEQYKIEQDRIEKLFKVREDAIKNEIDLIKKDPFLNPVEKIIKEGEAYDKLIKLNQDYYGALIENAKKYKQNTLDFETSRDIKAGDLSKSKEDAFLGMPGAMSEQIDYVNKLTESTKALNYEEAKNKILNDKRLSVSQREYLLSQLEIDRQIEILETNKQNLQIDLQNLEAKERTNNLTRQEKSDLAKIRIENEAITNEIEKQNQLKKQNENQKLISDLTPLRNVISDGLQGLGLGEISDEFDNLFTKILDKQSTFLEKFNAGFQLIGEYGKILVEQQTQRHIQELDKQLEYTKNATEQELGFIDKRLEYYSNMEDLTAEQIADRNALEDEARTYREQQEEREKLIAIQKAKAEQRASANKAIIGGLQGAAVSIANLGLPAGLPFAVASTTMGALMAALIMSKNPVPQYFVGRSGGRAEFALTQERGAEAIIDKKGNVKTWGNNKGAQLTWLDDGDSVLTASETIAMKRNLEPIPELDYNFYRNNAIKNIGAPIIVKNTDNSDAIAEKVGNRFDKIMNKYDKEHIFELNGQLYSQKGGQIPIRIGRAKKNKIEIKINKNGRD